VGQREEVVNSTHLQTDELVASLPSAPLPSAPFILVNQPDMISPHQLILIVVNRLTTVKQLLDRSGVPRKII